jgi:DNA replicative helicase MCM subunit Mcm2 (Cdc46/Mcm family)
MTSQEETHELPLGEDIEQLGLGLTKMRVTGDLKVLHLYNGREKPFESPYYKNHKTTVDAAVLVLTNSHEFDNKVIEKFAPLLDDRLMELQRKLLSTTQTEKGKEEDFQEEDFADVKEEGQDQGQSQTGSESIGRTNAIIELKMTKEVLEAHILTEFLYNFDSKSVLLKLNSQYQNMWVDSPVNLELSTQTCQELITNLQNHGVTSEHSTKLGDMLNSNSHMITQYYVRKTLEQTSTGRRKKKERIDRLKNTPPRDISVAQALMMCEAGTNVRVTGKLIGGSVIENMIEEVAFRCANCPESNILEDYRDTRPRLQSEIPSIFDPKNLCKQMCRVCLNKSIPHEPDNKYIPARRIELHGTETSNDIPHIDVYLFNNCTIDVLYNQQVKVTGSIQQVKVKDKLLPHIFVGLESDSWYKTNGVNAIEPAEQIESVEITDDDRKKMWEFLTKKNDKGIQNKDRLLDALAELVAPRHQGHENVKKGLLMAAVNTGVDSPRKKRRIDILLIGPTGLDKSGLASDAIRLIPGSKSASAADSTTNSLICVYDIEKEHFRFGPIPLASGKMLHIDEMGLMKEEDQQRILSSMQEGVIRFGRYGISRDIEASPSYIITANANSKSGKFRDPEQKKIDIQSESSFLGPILGRIDLIFIFRKEYGVEYLQKLADNMTRIDDNYSEFLKKEGNNYQFLMKWIVRAKEFEPKFSEEANIMLSEYFVNIRSQTDNDASDRLWNRLRNLGRAVARLEHKDIVDAKDAKEVVDFYNEQLKYWSQVAVVPSDPRDLAYQEIIKRLTDQKLPFEFIGLLKAVCNDDQHISQYIGFNKEDEHDWNVRTNIKVRYIRDKFTKGQRDERILILNISPLTLGWRETYTGGDKEVTVIDNESDVSDVSDVHIEPNKEIVESSNKVVNLDVISVVDSTVSDVSDVSDVHGKSNEENSDNDIVRKSNDDSSNSSKISNEGKNPGITCITPITLPTDKQESGIPDKDSLEDKSKNSSEDDEAYIAIQKKILGSEDQKLAARRIFNELAFKNANENPGTENEVLESKFKEILTSIGFNGDFASLKIIIEDMVKDRTIEIIVKEREDGTTYNILRKRGN